MQATASRAVIRDDKSLEVHWVGSYASLNALKTTVVNISFVVCLVVMQAIKPRTLPTPVRYPATRIHSYPFIYLLIKYLLKYRLYNCYQKNHTDT